MTTATKTARRQSLRQALTQVRSGKIRVTRCGLDGCPVGGWGETRQAMDRIQAELPHRSLRTYTLTEIVDALYTVDGADRYRLRAEVR